MKTIIQENCLMMKCLRMMMTETSRAKKLVKLLERLIQQNHLYEKERIEEMKGQLRAVKEQIAEIEKQNYKGFADQ